MKKIYLTGIISLFLITLYGQEISIYDEVTRQPVEYATLYSKSLNRSAITNANGQANITAFTGANDITIQMVGYLTETLSFDEIEAMNFTLYLRQSEISLDEVVVSASRHRQEKADVPNRIISIPAKAVTMQNPQTAADLLGVSGEVFIQKSQMGGGSPMIRGFAANRVLISVDGVRMNNAIFRSGNLQNVISVDPFAVERTEVVFGPGSLIYGSDAIGGVMSFYTFKPSLAINGKNLIKGSATLRYSSANTEKTGHFDINIGLKKWAFVTSVSYTDFDDLKMGSHGPEEYLRKEYVEHINGIDRVVENDEPELQIPTGYSQLNLMQKIRFKPTAKWDFNYGFIYSATTDIPRYDRLLQYKNDVLKYAEWYYGPQVWMMNNLHATNTRPSGLYNKFTITLAQQHFEESRHSRKFGKTDLKIRDEKVNVYSVNADFEKNLNKKHVLYYGGEILFNKVFSKGKQEDINTGETQPGPSRYPDNSTWNSYAVYASYHWKINSKLNLQCGLRFNQVLLKTDFDTTFYPFPFTSTRISNGALTGSAGLTYQPGKGWLMRANFTTGFRAPNIDDVAKVFDSEPGYVVVPNTGLKPEYAWNTDLGVSKRFGDRLEIDLSGFYTILDDAMVRRDFTFDGHDSIMYDGEMSRVEAVQNASQAWVWGFSVDVESNLPKGFGIKASYSYQKGKEEQEDGSTVPLRHAAPWFGAAHLTYSRYRLKVDLYAVYNGEIPYADLAPSERKKTYMYASDPDGNPYSPSWYTLNVKLLYRLSEFLMVNVGVENFTNQRYRPYSSGVAGAGINFIGALKFTF